MLNSRRARKVHLTGASEDLIRRGALLLEDALHTASLPESDGRLLVVKSLHVGAIRSDLSSAALALTIERRLREVSPVHASDPAAHLREAVYFRDDAEPSILLALRLARHESTQAWFWRLAVPLWKPEMSLDEALRAIFFNLTRTKAGFAAAIRLADELREQNALDPLLTALRPQDGTGLMQAFGWSKSSKTAESPVKIPAGWRAILSRWIPRWGRDDARVSWLAGVVLAADNPIRMLDPDLMMRAARVIENVVNVGGRAHRPTGTSIGRHAPLQTPFDAANVGAGLRPALTEDHMLEKTATHHIPPTDTTNIDGAPIQNHPPISSLNADSPDAQNIENPTENFSEVVEMSPVGAHGGAPMPDSEITFVQESSPAPWPDTPMKTQHAGLFFLIPVLTRLGIAEFLTPEWIEAKFPFHLLQYIGHHLGLPDDDPISAVLATDAAYDPQSNFVTLKSWRNGIANPGEPILRRLGEKSLLLDSSGRLILAMWNGKIPESIRDHIPAINSLPNRYGSDSPSPTHWRGGWGVRLDNPDNLLLNAWLTATRRWLRRNAHMGLADVVLRPGRITATRTHIDLFFDLSQANICVRRVGLDIDPGWVSWLGRVVTFHYGEQTE